MIIPLFTGIPGHNRYSDLSLFFCSVVNNQSQQLIIVFYPFTQLPRVTNPWDYRTVASPTAALQHLRNGISSTRPDLGDWVKSNVVNTWGPGAQGTTITYSGSRWTLVDQ